MLCRRRGPEGIYKIRRALLLHMTARSQCITMYPNQKVYSGQCLAQTITAGWPPSFAWE